MLFACAEVGREAWESGGPSSFVSFICSKCVWVRREVVDKLLAAGETEASDGVEMGRTGAKPTLQAAHAAEQATSGNRVIAR